MMVDGEVTVPYTRILIRRRQTNPKPISYEIGELPVSMAAEGTD